MLLTLLKIFSFFFYLANLNVTPEICSATLWDGPTLGLGATALSEKRKCIGTMLRCWADCLIRGELEPLPAQACVLTTAATGRGMREGFIQRTAFWETKSTRPFCKPAG